MAMALLAGGCASWPGFHTITAQVSSYGNWPASRTAQSYAFERLPSQQAQADLQQQLEEAARPALAAAGFKPVAEGAQPDVLVQVGARITRTEPSPWADPLWWRGPIGPWRSRYWPTPIHPPALWLEDLPREEREVAVLMRDRASSQPIYEARATHSGSNRAGMDLIRALFKAALMDFPASGLNPRPVNVPLAD
jgi:hypothetical protein